jgi:hypothetical protein
VPVSEHVSDGLVASPVFDSPPDRGPKEVKELWGSLFLTLSQVHELIDHVGSRQARPWVYSHSAVKAGAPSRAR